MTVISTAGKKTIVICPTQKKAYIYLLPSV